MEWPCLHLIGHLVKLNHRGDPRTLFNRSRRPSLIPPSPSKVTEYQEISHHHKRSASGGWRGSCHPRLSYGLSSIRFECTMASVSQGGTYDVTTGETPLLPACIYYKQLQNIQGWSTGYMQAGKLNPWAYATSLYPQTACYFFTPRGNPLFSLDTSNKLPEMNINCKNRLQCWTVAVRNLFSSGRKTSVGEDNRVGPVLI